MKSGLLLIDKPAGMTCTRVGSRVKRALDVKKVGHVGTLDPFATGLLPLAIGRATAVVRYMDDYDKRYQVRCRLGRSTDSLDISGKTTACSELTPTQAERILKNDANLVREQLSSMLGEISQIPPLHSALKIAGRRLYDYAHSGEPAPEIPARKVTIYEAELLACFYDAAGDPDAPIVLDIDIFCSKGSYIRTFCADLGQKLGLPAYAEQLRRTAVGPFTIENARLLDDLSEEIELLPIDLALRQFPMVEFLLPDVDRLLCGLQVAGAPYLPQINVPIQSGMRCVITSTCGPAGMCQLRSDENGAYFFIVERMFSDRASYFTR